MGPDIRIDFCPHLGYSAEFKDNILTKLDVLARARFPESGGEWHTMVIPVIL